MAIYESYKGIYTHRILTQRYTSILKERREYLEILKKLTIFAVPKRTGSSSQKGSSCSKVQNDVETL